VHQKDCSNHHRHKQPLRLLGGVRVWNILGSEIYRELALRLGRGIEGKDRLVKYLCLPLKTGKLGGNQSFLAVFV